MELATLTDALVAAGFPITGIRSGKEGPELYETDPLTVQQRKDAQAFIASFDEVTYLSDKQSQNIVDAISNLASSTNPETVALFSLIQSLAQQQGIDITAIQSSAQQSLSQKLPSPPIKVQP